MSKFDKHLSKGKQISIKNANGEEDTFYLEALPFSKIGDLFAVMKSFSKVNFKEIEELPEEEKTKQLLEVLDKPTVTLMGELVLETLKISYPNEDVKILEKFSSSHFMKLLPVILEINTGNLQK